MATKPKLEPRNKRIHGKRQRQSKTHNDLRLATWNVQTMNESGKLEEVIGQQKKYQVDIMAVQEIRWKRKGTLDSDDHALYYSGSERGGEYGTGFLHHSSFLAISM